MQLKVREKTSPFKTFLMNTINAEPLFMRKHIMIISAHRFKHTDGLWLTIISGLTHKHTLETSVFTWERPDEHLSTSGHSHMCTRLFLLFFFPASCWVVLFFFAVCASLFSSVFLQIFCTKSRKVHL